MRELYLKNMNPMEVLLISDWTAMKGFKLSGSRKATPSWQVWNWSEKVGKGRKFEKPPPKFTF